MLVWPAGIFPAPRQRWQLRGVAITTAPSISGPTQTARADGGGYWAVELNDIALRSADQLRAWRAWEMMLDGGAQEFVFSLCDPRQRPTLYLPDGRPVRTTFTLHSDSAPFADGARYAAHPIDSRALEASALRATTITFRMNSGHEIRTGEHFSINHPGKGWRMYRVRSVLLRNGNDYSITFRPPLREPIKAGIWLEWNEPKLVMRLDGVDGMSVEIEEHMRATESVTFVESFS